MLLINNVCKGTLPLLDGILQTLPIPADIIQDGGDIGRVGCLGVVQELRAQTAYQILLLHMALHLALIVLQESNQKERGSANTKNFTCSLNDFLALL